MTHANDWFSNPACSLVEKTGRIRIIQNGEVLDTPFLYITQNVGSDSLEQGFLGLVFHPDYIHNGWFYIYYSDRWGNRGAVPIHRIGKRPKHSRYSQHKTYPQHQPPIFVPLWRAATIWAGWVSLCILWGTIMRGQRWDNVIRLAMPKTRPLCWEKFFGWM